MNADCISMLCVSNVFATASMVKKSKSMFPETSAVSHCWNRDFLESWKSFLHIIKYYAEFCNFISYPSVTVFRIPKILCVRR